MTFEWWLIINSWNNSSTKNRMIVVIFFLLMRSYKYYSIGDASSSLSNEFKFSVGRIFDPPHALYIATIHESIFIWLNNYNIFRYIQKAWIIYRLLGFNTMTAEIDRIFGIELLMRIHFSGRRRRSKRVYWIIKIVVRSDVVEYVC